MPVGMKPVSVNEYGSIVYTPPRIISATKNVLPSGDDADVLRHAARSTAQGEVAHHRVVHDVDLHEAALELAGEDRELPVDREVGVVDAGALGDVDGGLVLHRLRVEEVESLARLGHHDRRLAVGREVHVVGIVDRDGRSTRLAGLGVDRREGAVGRPSALFVTQSVLRSHDGTMCCGFSPTLNVLTTCIVAGSITDTSFEPRLGT